MLNSLTVTVNFASLMAAFWLGLYVAARGRWHPAPVFSALGLWSLGGMFLNQLLAIYPPEPPPGNIETWLIHLMLFWPDNVFHLGWKGWLQGWMPAYSLSFLYHASLFFLPGRFNTWRTAGAVAGYLLALASIQLGAFHYMWWTNPAQDVLLVSPQPQPLAATLIVGYLLFACLSAANLWRAGRASTPELRRGPHRLLLSAVLGGGAAALLIILPTFLAVDIPQVLPAVLLAGSLLLAGAGFTGSIPAPGRRAWTLDMRDSSAAAAAAMLAFVFLLGILAGRRPLPVMAFVSAGTAGIFAAFLARGAHITRATPTVEEKSEASAQKATALPPLVAVPDGEPITTELVELGLRNLYDYAYLADLPLAQLHIVNQCLDDGRPGHQPSHIDRGRAVSHVLAEAVYRLRPDPVDPPSPLPRSWHPFTILREAYLDDRPNLEIMTRLYISESTFNRTRRSAIHSVARLLGEMERVAGNIAVQPDTDSRSKRQRQHRVPGQKAQDN